MILDMYITIEPHVKARITDSSMADTMPRARVVLMNWPMEFMDSCGSFAILYVETAMAEPSRQKISDTVVEVGSPSELYTSSRIMFASMTAK